VIVVMLSAPYANLTEKEREGVKGVLRLTSEWLWQQGIACVTPHLNTDGHDDAAAREHYLRGYAEIASRCDAVLQVCEFVVAGESEGMERERKAAPRWFNSVVELVRWWQGLPEEVKR